ncbi:hypothetical protein BT63DRAFT_423150 [Microthyrium microscopicum]|uniref:AD domain-containing protein n=1 Tax=Microthyrium microscopicum TaxID=703497 RepID=A0A6A6UF09_9PEZI|nr:hypothetical protein BT63DRAFT_423150 [Microthyrium microscopicum]
MDQKRNSVVGRVATPKAGATGGLGAPQSMTELDAALPKAIGGRIRLTTSQPNATSLEGLLFTACPITNLLVINTAAANAPGDFHVIPVAQVASYQILSINDTTPSTDATPTISRPEMDALRAREEDTIRKMKEYDSSRGKGVSKEAQEVFDWFRRTLPVRWNNQQIVVNDAVVVNPPYAVEDCRAPKDKQAAESQIKRVLEGFYAKKKGGHVGSNANSGANTPVPGGNRPVPALPRKGG